MCVLLLLRGGSANKTCALRFLARPMSCTIPVCMYNNYETSLEWTRSHSERAPWPLAQGWSYFNFCRAHSRPPKGDKKVVGVSISTA